MTRRLIVMRHAKSDWANSSLSDHDRPLNDRGRRVAPLMGRHFKTQLLQPSAVIASTAQRVRETLTLLVSELPCEPQLFFEQSLYLASCEGIVAHVRDLDDAWEDTMIVGHNPGLSDFVRQLSTQHIEMPTAAVAILESQSLTWAEAIAAKPWRLTEYWRPSELFD